MSFGTTRFEPWQLEEAEGLPLLEHAFKQGINTWDTVRQSPPSLSPTCIPASIREY
jgi:hypothetical protein